MFLPIGTDRPRKRPTLVTYWLMGLCAGVYFLQVVLQRADPALHEKMLGLGVLSSFSDPWQLITYQFLHADMIHLLGNMLFLWVFGPPVEDRITRLGFAGFYLIGGIVAGTIHLVFTGHPVLGASGSISAVTGAFLVFFPRTHIRLLVFLFIIGVFSIPSWWFIAFAIARDLIFNSLGSSNVAYLAHLGGYAYGAGVSLSLLACKVVAREPAYDLLSIGKQAHRRRVFKELANKSQSPWAGDPPRDAKVSQDAPPDPRAEERASRRAEIHRALAAGEAQEAIAAYERFLDFDAQASLNKDSQLQIANLLFSEGRHATALSAYEIFASKYPHDADLPRVQLMRALIDARYLNDPLAAQKILEELEVDRLDAAHRELALTLRSELG